MVWLDRIVFDLVLRRSCYVTWIDLKLVIFLPQPPVYWNDICVILRTGRKSVKAILHPLVAGKLP